MPSYLISSSLLSRFISGCLLIAILSLIVWATLPSTVNPTPSHLTLYATFQNIEGIKKGSLITFAGITVGHVKDINFTSQNKDSVTLTLFLTEPPLASQQLLLPDDSSIRIVTPDIFSKKILLIEPGGGFNSLHNGDSFFFTQNAIVLDDIIQYVMLSQQQQNNNITSP